MKTVKELLDFLDKYPISSIYIQDEINSDLFVLNIFDDYITVINKGSHNIYDIKLEALLRSYKEGRITFFMEDIIDV